ncbi:nuclear transport factor 2 family protein [Ectothiorhodospiraceae bacterium 2226]|nr:nuclear transport factor 2 family protein [Ectothiorhodospiraceae bacterium 2226]
MLQQAFESSEAAERAFYAAFERGDVQAMMAVWAPDETIECIHPHGPRLRGQEAVRRSWEAILGAAGGARFTLADRQIVVDGAVALHTLTETLQVPAQPAAQVLATNVYRRSGAGWHLILHHASPPFRSGRAARAGLH